MKFHCLICGEGTHRNFRVIHLKKHNCTLRDMQKYKLFGWYPTDIKVPASKDFKCPTCGDNPSSQVLYYNEIKSGNMFNCKMLSRCSSCGGLFFMEKKVRKSDIKCRTCSQIDTKGDNPFCKYLQASMEEKLLDKEEYCDGYSKS